MNNVKKENDFGVSEIMLYYYSWLNRVKVHATCTCSKKKKKHLITKNFFNFRKNLLEIDISVDFFLSLSLLSVFVYGNIYAIMQNKAVKIWILIIKLISNFIQTNGTDFAACPVNKFPINKLYCKSNVDHMPNAQALRLKL